MIAQLVVDAQVLKNIIQDPRFYKLLPCLVNASERLRAVPATKGGCGRCQKRRLAAENPVLTDVRNCIMRLDEAGRNEFKRLLNTQRVVITAGQHGALASVAF